MMRKLLAAASAMILPTAPGRQMNAPKEPKKTTIGILEGVPGGPSPKIVKP
ncbi:MAG: hypothetical protein HY518_01735 [Candidatus Aenigmarchaeota archaeon]|nr:hypothetical protein [Candidatus Aenigmarchaeota archaeon]